MPLNIYQNSKHLIKEKTLLKSVKFKTIWDWNSEYDDVSNGMSSTWSKKSGTNNASELSKEVSYNSFSMRSHLEDKQSL